MHHRIEMITQWARGGRDNVVYFDYYMQRWERIDRFPHGTVIVP